MMHSFIRVFKDLYTACFLKFVVQLLNVQRASVNEAVVVKVGSTLCRGVLSVEAAEVE